MSLNTVLLALTVLASIGSTAEHSHIVTGGQAQSNVTQDSVFPPVPSDSSPSSEFLGWHGWAYLGGVPSNVPQLYDSVGDWSGVKARIGTLKNGKPSQWRLKVVIFTRIQSDARDAKGVLREHRQTIESVQLAQVQAALERLKGWVKAKYDDRVAIVPDIQIESDWMRDSEHSSDDQFGAEFAKKYLEARVNGGTYDAEDKVFRGPFNSIFYILPGARVTPTILTTVNRTPVTGISAQLLDEKGFSAYLDGELRTRWLQQVEGRVRELGFKGTTSTISSVPGDDPWTVATSLDEVPPQTYFSRIGTSLELWPTAVDPVPVKVSRLPEVEVTVVTDPDRGQVLKVVEAAGIRTGGLALPARKDGLPLSKLDATPTFSFMAKSTCHDPLSIRLESSDGKTAWLSIGQDPRLVAPLQTTVTYSTAFVPDGKWQKIAIDLRQLVQKLGMTDVVRMAIEPSPNAKLAGKQRPEPVEYEFDEFRFSADAGQPNLPDVVADAASDDPESRALFASAAKTPTPELASLLKDKNELVRLNATAAYTSVKDQAAESSLVSNSLDLDPSIASMALRALMFEGTDTAVGVVRRSVRVAISDYARQTAAELLAQTKDPKMAGDVSLLMSNRSWVARLSGVESLSLFTSPEAGLMRLAFINGTDPQIKLAVTRHTDANREEDSRVLLWSAVNEPFDMVRAESDIKLIQSTTGSNRAEGYKGVRDDSKFVRIRVLDYLASDPKDEHRNAIRVAIADRSAIVRAAAVRAFAALPVGPTNDEIANVLDDLDPNVQLALIDLVKKKGTKLPQKTLDAMLSSQDARVAVAAKGLSG